MSSNVVRKDRVLMRRKILVESNNKYFNTKKFEPKTVNANIEKVKCQIIKNIIKEEQNGKKNSFGTRNQKSSSMVVLVPGESSYKSPIKAQVLEPVFVPANVDETKVKRNIHTQIHLSYLKSLYKGDKQKTISKWNVGLKKRLVDGCRINTGRFILEPFNDTCQNNSKTVDALFNLYNNVTQEILDTVNVGRDISSISL